MPLPKGEEINEIKPILKSKKRGLNQITNDLSESKGEKPS